MTSVRATFEKRRRAKYISHLDLMRCMQRAFRRAEVPIWFTEGFNPHAYLMFPLALSLGYESGCECMDFRLEGGMSMQTAMQKLNAVLPPDLQIVRVAQPIRKHTDIALASYTLCLDSPEPERLRAAWDAFFAQPEICIEKKTKRGTAPIDLKTLVQVQLTQTLADGLFLQLQMPAGTAVNVNPNLLLDAFAAQGGTFGMVHATRCAILCADGSEFA